MEVSYLPSDHPTKTLLWWPASWLNLSLNYESHERNALEIRKGIAQSLRIFLFWRNPGF